MLLTECAWAKQLGPSLGRFPTVRDWQIPTEEIGRNLWQDLGPALLCLSHLRAGLSPWSPSADDRLAGNRLDLLAESIAIQRHQRIVRAVRRAADRICSKHNSESVIHRVHHGSEHAHVGLRPCDHERI